MWLSFYNFQAKINIIYCYLLKLLTAFDPDSSWLYLNFNKAQYLK